MAVRRSAPVFFLAACAAIFLCVPTAAQQPAGVDPEPAADAAAAVSVEALQLGEAMGQSAPQEFLKWARGFARKSLFKMSSPATPETVRLALQERYPQLSGRERQAAAFLVWYAGYQRGVEMQQVAASRVSDRDRQLRELEHEMRLGEGAPLSNLTTAKLPSFHEDLRPEHRWEEVQRQRRFNLHQLQSVTAQVDVCLRNLSELYEQVRHTPRTTLQAMK